jgi:hypothetical protein
MFSISIPMRSDRCELCRFTVTEARARAPAWGTIPANSYHAPDMYNVLICKRMPPVANKDGVGISPEVNKGNYCGEFKEKEGAR